VGPAAFKAVESRLTSGLVGSIPIHSRLRHVTLPPNRPTFRGTVHSREDDKYLLPAAYCLVPSAYSLQSTAFSLQPTAYPTSDIPHPTSYGVHLPHRSRQKPAAQAPSGQWESLMHGSPTLDPPLHVLTHKAPGP